MFEAARRWRRVRVMAAFAILALSAAAKAAATPITYLVGVNTSGITGLMGKLDFQFNPGSGTLSASVDISSFSSTGGSLTGSPTLNGGASGNLTSTVHIANSGGLNEYLQNFTFGTALQFQIFFSGAALSSPNNTSTDTFGLALYNSSFMPQLNNGSQGDFIATVDVNTDGSTTPHLASSPSGLVTVTPVVSTGVPEPSTWALCGIAMSGIALWRRRRRCRAGWKPAAD